MAVSEKQSKVSSIIAGLCIAAYFAAVGSGVFQVIQSIGERRLLAEREFFSLTETASSSAVLHGFMSDAYKQSITEFIRYESQSLLGAIISSPSGNEAFERAPGSGIVWAGTSPSFRTGAANFAKVIPYPMTLRIEGEAFVRTANIEVLYRTIDNNELLRILRNTLLPVLGALGVAFFVFFTELMLRNRAQKNAAGKKEKGRNETTLGAQTEKQKEKASDVAQDIPQGLFSPRGNIGWESYTAQRLEAELHRCASSEQDLALLVMEFMCSGEVSDDVYRQFSEEAVSFFTTRDLIFEKGKKGISAIIPGEAHSQAITKAEEFRRRIKNELAPSFENSDKLYVGISCRSGRLIKARRLMLEAETALSKTLDEPVSPVIAFKSDLDKYRQFVKKQTV